MCIRVGRYYVSLKQGTLTLFWDHESLDAVVSYNLASCELQGYAGASDAAKREDSHKNGHTEYVGCRM